MDKTDIERLMKSRVKEIESWDVNDSNNIITGLKLRSFLCTATPIAHVFEERRKECGVTFTEL